jgi:hypothetical protein
MPRIPDDETHDTQPMPVLPAGESEFHLDDEADLPALVIRKGEAQAALSRALDELTRAYVAVEACGMAIARALDGAT